MRGRGPQEAVSSPPERGVSSRERGLPRAQLLCWVGKPAGGPEQGRVQATSRLGGFLCVQSWHRTFSSQSRDGKEAAGWGRVSWYFGGGVPVIFSGLCFLCLPETSAPGGWSWCAGARGPMCPLPCSQGSGILWRLQLGECAPDRAPEACSATRSCLRGVFIPLPCNYCRCVVTSPLASCPSTGRPWRSSTSDPGLQPCRPVFLWWHRVGSIGPRKHFSSSSWCEAQGLRSGRGSALPPGELVV